MIHCPSCGATRVEVQTIGPVRGADGRLVGRASCVCGWAGSQSDLLTRHPAEEARDAWLGELRDLAKAMGYERATSPDFGEVDVVPLHALATNLRAGRVEMARDAAALASGWKARTKDGERVAAQIADGIRRLVT